jgi:protein ImuB
VFARSGNVLRLVAGDALAARLGLGPGTALADARARYPALVAIERDAQADRHWLKRMGQGCIRYAPHVMLHPPDGIGLDITGAAHLFGGEQAMVDLVMDRFHALGMTVRSACGATLEAAQALARYASWPTADESIAVRALPIQALGLDEETIRGLQRAGLKTVGAVAARPMAAIAARFGMEAVTAIERLTGGQQAPVIALKPPRPLRFERRFADPVTHQDVIAKVLLELMRAAARALEEREHGGRRFRLELHRSDGATHELVIETGAPTRDPALVLRLFDERIGTLTDPLDPGFGYDSIVLTITATEPLASAQLGLDRLAGDGAAKADAALAELIDRLSTRFGPDRIRRLVPQDSHIPEQAQLALPVIQSSGPASWPSAPLGEPPTRPVFLFDPPQPVEVIAEVPDGPPHRFRWRRKLHEVRLYEGPERIAAEWWRRRGGEESGSGGLTRDYYRIEDVRGRRFWIFRHGLYAEKTDPRWYLHGLFA